MQGIRFVFYVVVVMLFSNCSPYTYTYVNQLPNDPAFERGQQAKVGGTIGYLSAKVQGSVSPVNHVALLGGYALGYAGQRAHSYGGQLFTRVYKTNKGNVFASMAFLAERGSMDGSFGNKQFYKNGVRSFDIHLNYTGINWQPSIYFSQNKKEGEKYKLGITAKISSINYQRLYFKETWRDNAQDTTLTTFLADGKDIDFRGTSAWVYLMYEGKKDRFYAITQLGLMYSGNTARLLNGTVTEYRFKYIPLITATFGIRLWKR